MSEYDRKIKYQLKQFNQSTYDYVKLYYDFIINNKGWEMI